MSPDDRFQPAVIELAGLPGSGKTTVANAIAEIDDRFLPHTVRNRNQRYEIGVDSAIDTSMPSERRDFIIRLIPWFLIPVTVVRFRSFLVHFIYLYVSICVRALFRTTSFAEEINGKLPGLRMILSRLNWIVARSIQVRMRVQASKKSVLVEQGYVQEAISIRFRLPKKWRDQLWHYYILGVPKNCVCVVLKISASEAVDRISRREIEQPSLRFMKWAHNSWHINDGPEELYMALEDASRSLENKITQSRFNFVYITAARSRSSVQDGVHEAVRHLSQSSGV